MITNRSGWLLELLTELINLRWENSDNVNDYGDDSEDGHLPCQLLKTTFDHLW